MCVHSGVFQWLRQRKLLGSEDSLQRACIRAIDAQQGFVKLVLASAYW